MPTLKEIRTTILEPAYKLLPPNLNSDRATVQLLSMGLQESKFLYQKQIGGPAHGLWQFERAGGVKGVLNHKATKAMALSVCAALNVKPDPESVYQALKSGDDRLDACFARLLLYSDPKPLPKLGDSKEAWDLYLRVWRPGKPHPKEWPANYAAALKEVTG